MLHAFIDRTLILTGWSDAIWFLLLPKPHYLMLPGMKYWGLKKKKKIIIIIIIIIRRRIETYNITYNNNNNNENSIYFSKAISMVTSNIE